MVMVGNQVIISRQKEPLVIVHLFIHEKKNVSFVRSRATQSKSLAYTTSLGEMSPNPYNAIAPLLRRSYYYNIN